MRLGYKVVLKRQHVRPPSYSCTLRHALLPPPPLFRDTFLAPAIFDRLSNSLSPLDFPIAGFHKNRLRQF